MPHSWKAYEIAEKITKRLIEANYVPKKDELMIRGIIQIILEDEFYECVS